MFFSGKGADDCPKPFLLGKVESIPSIVCFFFESHLNSLEIAPVYLRRALTASVILSTTLGSESYN
jgi:hypothetical protein